MMCLAGQTVMDHLAPAYVPSEDTGLFRVKEPGWYAFDDDHLPVLARISHTTKRIGAPNQRKWLCGKTFERFAERPDADRV
jgi:hypothetical protein